MLGPLHGGVHLFPDFMMGKETSQLSFCEWAPVIGVTVSREHVDAHSINFTDIHRPEIEAITNVNNQEQTRVI